MFSVNLSMSTFQSIFHSKVSLSLYCLRHVRSNTVGICSTVQRLLRMYSKVHKRLVQFVCFNPVYPSSPQLKHFFSMSTQDCNRSQDLDYECWRSQHSSGSPYCCPSDTIKTSLYTRQHRSVWRRGWWTYFFPAMALILVVYTCIHVFHYAVMNMLCTAMLWNEVKQFG